MKLKISIIAQIIFLLAAIAAGATLKGDLADGPRSMHRLAGILAGIAGLIVIVKLFMFKKTTAAKALATVAFVLTLGAAVFGNSLKTTDNYDQTYTMMRLFAVGALAVSVATLTQVKTAHEHAATKDETEKNEE